MKPNKTTVQCSDWHRSWGFGTNHIGKLTKNEDGTYLWKGHQQGRWGAVWNRGMAVLFRLVGDDQIEVINPSMGRKKNGTLPTHTDVIAAIKLLNQ